MSRTQLGILAVVAIVATRLVIGWHFYSEGTRKLKDDSWSASGFLGQARGPFAGVFTSITPQKYALLDSLFSDPAEEENLEDEQIEELAAWRSRMQERYELDFSDFTIEPTVKAWWRHREKLGDHYGFQKAKLDETLKKERAETRKVVIQLRDQRRAVFPQLQELQTQLSEDATQASAKPAPASDVVATASGDAAAESEGVEAASKDTETASEDTGAASEEAASPPEIVAAGSEEVIAEPTQGDSDSVDPTAGTVQLTAADRELLEKKKEELARLGKQYDQLDQKYRDAEQLYKQQEQEILTVRNQHDRSIAAIEQWTQQLEVWIAANHENLSEYSKYRERVKTNSEEPARQGVATLQGQGTTIEGDMKKKAAPLAAGLADLWEGFNSQLNRMAVATQAELDEMEIKRPDGVPDRLQLINKVTPWFDVIVGGLLILGLFTRLAALAAAGFLGMIVLSQAPWMADTSSEVFAYTAEMFALLVLAAVGAGRFAGLDFFLRCIYYAVFPPKTADSRRYEAQRPATAEGRTAPATEEHVEPVII